MTREQLLRRAGHLGSPVKEALEADSTVVESVPTPFFSRAAIHRISTRPPLRPKLYYVGLANHETTLLLNQQPENFFKLAAEGALNLAPEPHRVLYAVTFLESTVDYSGDLQILNKIEEAWWLPKMRPEEEQAKEAIVAKYRNVVHEPRLAPGSSATVVAFVIRRRELRRVELKLETSGRIQVQETVLEPEVPVVYIR